MWKIFQRRKCSFFRWFDPRVLERQKKIMKIIRGLLKKNDALKNKEKSLVNIIVIFGILLFLSQFTYCSIVLNVMLFRLLTYALVYHMQFVIWKWSNEISLFTLILQALFLKSYQTNRRGPFLTGISFDLLSILS